MKSFVDAHNHNMHTITTNHCMYLMTDTWLQICIDNWMKVVCHAWKNIWNLFVLYGNESRIVIKMSTKALILDVWYIVNFHQFTGRCGERWWQCRRGSGGILCEIQKL